MDQSKINRRGFLCTMGAGAAGFGFAAQAGAQTQGRGSASPASGLSPDVLIRALPRTGEQLIRARDGADRAELEAVAEIALAGWDHITATIGHGM